MRMTPQRSTQPVRTPRGRRLYVGVVPALKTPFRPAEPDRASCTAGGSDERRHGARHLAKLDHRVRCPPWALRHTFCRYPPNGLWRVQRSLASEMSGASSPSACSSGRPAERSYASPPARQP
jgi:hypothetical protein